MRFTININKLKVYSGLLSYRKQKPNKQNENLLKSGLNNIYYQHNWVKKEENEV